MIKLDCYKSPYGVFMKDVDTWWWSNRKVNGKVAVNSHSNRWKLLEGEEEIKSIVKTIKTISKVIGYVLVDESLASEKIPSRLTTDQVGLHWDDDCEGYRWENYSQLRSLYKEVYSVEEVIEEDEEFEVNYLGSLTVEDLDAPHKASVQIKLPDAGWSSKPPTLTIISSLAQYEEIVKAVVPDLLIHTQQCTIPSTIAYQIVRGFIKNNIDLKHASITSDYDFCFTVKKKVGVEPTPWKTEITTTRGKSYRPPRFKTGTKTFKEVEIFEMTHTMEKYRGYTPIEGFFGNNLKELVDNVQTYLEELISYINTPFEECTHCKGTGHIVGEKFKINLRGSDED